MNLHLLRIFFTVAREHRFSKAAEVLHISQPAVSKGVRELEHQLDTALIERNRRKDGVRLTDMGQVLFDHATGIFALEKAAREDVQSRLGLHRGSLTIGASTTIAGYWLSAHLAAFVARYPDIDIDVRTGNTGQVSQWLLDCEVDVALVEGPVDDPRLACRHWRNDELAIIAPPAPGQEEQEFRTVAELARARWIIREAGSGTRRATEHLLDEWGITPQRQMTMGNNEAVLDTVSQGLGVALLPWVVARPHLDLGHVERLPIERGDALQRPLFELIFIDRPASPPAQAFSQMLSGSESPR